jgi:hypothetical protein
VVITVLDVFVGRFRRWRSMASRTSTRRLARSIFRSRIASIARIISNAIYGQIIARKLRLMQGVRSLPNSPRMFQVAIKILRVDEERARVTGVPAIGFEPMACAVRVRTSEGSPEL